MVKHGPHRHEEEENRLRNQDGKIKATSGKEKSCSLCLTVEGGHHAGTKMMKG